MFENSGRKILLGVVTGTLLSTAVATALAADRKTTHHLLDSSGNPVKTSREGECVWTPNTPNNPDKPFQICGDNIANDRDHDGIVDEEDRCPDNTPVEIAKGVYQSGPNKGCPLDSDNDGVPDYRDDCPLNTPIEISRGVDSRGCPLDSDGDGVPDYRDKCPGTPAGLPVDKDGCHEYEKAGPDVTLSGDVLFAFDSSKLSPQGRATLDGIVSSINAYITQGVFQGVEIVGHTDSIGKERYNQRLSEKRAAAVANYFVARGIPFDKITQRGEGERNPLAPNNTKLGRAQNRRVVITITTLERQ